MTSPRNSIGVRVRPNSHDFIRDLRADLASKQYTFHVTVGARTHQATKDVREWARTTLPGIQAHVRVHARTGPATSELQKWRAWQRTQGVTLPVEIDTSKAIRELNALRAMADTITIKVRTQEVGRRRQVRENTEATIRREVAEAVKVAEAVESATERVRRRATRRQGPPGTFDRNDRRRATRAAGPAGRAAEIKIDLDTKPAEKTAAEFKAKTERITVKQQVEMDYKKARTELALLRAQELRKKLQIKVEVKKTGFDQLMDTMGTFEKRFGSFTPIRSLDFGPFTLGRPKGLVGTLTTLTALAGAMPAVVTGAAALSNALTSLAAAAALVPGALAGIGTSIGVMGIAFSGVGETIGAMFDMWGEGASEQAGQAASLVSAQNNYRNSLVDEQRAQEDVARARREALGDMRDLNNELRGGVLNEAQAILDLQKARDRYAKGGFDNETDRLQAVLDVRKAEQNLIDTREGNIDLQQRANEANDKGVEGSDKVRDALEAQTRAAQSTAAALTALSEAQRGGAGMTAFSDALGQLSPNAQDFIMTIAGMKGEIEGFKLTLQDIATSGLGPAVQGLFDDLMPIIQPGTERIAAAINENIKTVFASLGSEQGQSIIERILGGTAEAQEGLNKVIDPLVRGIGTLVASSTEHLPQVIDLVGRLADRFANFIEEADRNGSLDNFMTRGVDALEDLAEIGINAIKIVEDLSRAFGGDILDSIAKLTTKWSEFLDSDEGQQKVQEFIDQAQHLWEKWQPVLSDLPALFAALGDAATHVLDLMLPLLNAFTSALEHAPWLVEAFAAAWLTAKMASAISTVVGLGKTIGSIVTGLTGLPGLLSKVPGFGNMPGAPNQFGIPNPPVVAGPGGAAGAARGALGTLGAVGTLATLPAILAPVITAGTVDQIPQDYSVKQEDADKFIAEIDAKLPAGLKIQDGRVTIDGMVAQGVGGPAAKWADEAQDMIGGGAQVEFAKRWAWLVANQKAFEDPNFKPPPAYFKGGYTPWGQHDGKIVELHGKEYVQPANVVETYGLDVMRAMHEKRIPPGLLQGFAGSFYNGGQVTKDQNLADPMLNNLVQHGASGFGNVVANVGNISQGIGAGPAPGPAGGASTSSTNLDILGFQVPLDTSGLTWPGGTPPVGLGGGDDGFDIRNYGIGPGPAGSGPADWAKWTGEFAANTVMSFGETLLSGFLGGLGLGGLMNNPLINAGKGLAGHFASAANDSDSVQGAGAAQTNADVNNLLNTYAAMPTNGAYPNVPTLPGVFDPTTGSALGASAAGGAGAGSGGKGLQINTARGKAIIQQNFPWATNIGGVRADALKWHPQGLALDVMIPGAGGLNDPTPPQGKALGDQLYAWLMANKAQLGIDYIMWQEKDHFNHLHVNFAASGYPDGSTPVGVPNISGPPTKPPTAGNTPAPPSWGAAAAESLPKPAAPKAGKALVAAPPGTPIGDLLLGNFAKGTHDQGGWLKPGMNVVANWTGKPELTVPYNDIPKFINGGYNFPTGVVPPKIPIPPRPPVTPARPRIEQPAAPRPVAPAAPAAPQAPQPAIPAITPQAPPPPPEAHGGTGAEPGPQRQQPQYVPGVGQTSSGAGADQFMHLHPAIRKGIASGAATIGALADTAVAVGTMGATMGMGGGAAGAIGGGGGGGGGGGLSVGGMIQQGGKILANIANVGASFLVGNITGGTTENPYGVTQRGSIPSGGTRMVDASNTHNGDIYTNNLDEYFAREKRREDQKAQAGLGRWGNA